jgi:hypothetical protein
VKKWQIAMVVVAVLAVGVGALFGGRAWGATASPEDTSQSQAAAQGWPDGNFPGMRDDGSTPSGGPGGFVRNGENMVSGNIIAVDDSGITVQTNDGSTKIVLVAGSTSITVTEEVGRSDLVEGEDVVVIGTTNSDGTVTAASVRLGSVFGPGLLPTGPSGPVTSSTAGVPSESTNVSRPSS